MITLQEIFDDLAFGELANVSIGVSKTTGSLEESAYPKIISAINLALTALYERFNLRQSKLILHEQDEIDLYYLRSSRLSDIAYMDEDQYIEEAESEEELFKDDIIKVLELYDDSGVRIPLNEVVAPETDISCYTPAFDVLQVKSSLPSQIIHIEFQAYYPKIVLTEKLDPEKYILHIPSYIKEPLLAYVAARFFKGKSSTANEGENHPTKTFMAQYENACTKIELFGLANINKDNVDQKFEEEGWA